MNEIETKLAEIEGRIAKLGGEWGSVDSNVAYLAKHQLCKLACNEVPRLVAALRVANEMLQECKQNTAASITVVSLSTFEQFDRRITDALNSPEPK